MQSVFYFVPNTGLLLLKADSASAIKRISETSFQSHPDDRCEYKAHVWEEWHRITLESYNNELGKIETLWFAMLQTIASEALELTVDRLQFDKDEFTALKMAEKIDVLETAYRARRFRELEEFAALPFTDGDVDVDEDQVSGTPFQGTSAFPAYKLIGACAPSRSW